MPDSRWPLIAIYERQIHKKKLRISSEEVSMPFGPAIKVGVGTVSGPHSTLTGRAARRH